MVCCHWSTPQPITAATETPPPARRARHAAAGSDSMHSVFGDTSPRLRAPVFRKNKAEGRAQRRTQPVTQSQTGMLGTQRLPNVSLVVCALTAHHCKLLLLGHPCCAAARGRGRRRPRRPTPSPASSPAAARERGGVGVWRLAYALQRGSQDGIRAAARERARTEARAQSLVQRPVVCERLVLFEQRPVVRHVLEAKPATGPELKARGVAEGKKRRRPRDRENREQAGERRAWQRPGLPQAECLLTKSGQRPRRSQLAMASRSDR